MTMALLSSSPTTPTHHHSPLSPPHKPYHHTTFSPPLTKPKRTHLSLSTTSTITRSTSDNGGATAATVVTETSDEEKEVLETPPTSPPPPPTPAAAAKAEVKEESVGPTGAAAAAEVKKFLNPKWVNGTWDLKQFLKDGNTDWDAVIDAEAKRRKWLETYPESTSNNEPVVFDTSIIPWWAWIKRFHLPEAELLNGRAAMVGFFMSYFVDSLTGLGVVDQMSNFFCKTLLFAAVLGVLLVRKNEDVDNLKKLLEETTFYDKQWQATWQDDSSTSKKQ